MSDFPASLPIGLPAIPELLPTLLALLPTGVGYYMPQFDAAGEAVDFALTYLNPAAQRMLGLPAQPATTLVRQFPSTPTNGALAFHRQAWRAGGEPVHFEINYQTDGLDNYFQVDAQRLGDGLLVSFSDTAHQPRTAVELALRAAQAAAQAARAEAEQQQRQLHEVLMQLPANIVVLQGPAHVYTLVNPYYQQLFPGRQLLGRAVREALPELAGQDFFDVLDRVYQTGEPFYFAEAETWALFAGSGEPQLRYYNAVFLPLQNGQGEITGIINLAFDVTALVASRRQLQQLNEDLELRVTARSAEARAALHEAEQQREHARQQQALLGQILRQVPVSIATLSGPAHRFTFCNEPWWPAAPCWAAPWPRYCPN